MSQAPKPPDPFSLPEESLAAQVTTEDEREPLIVEVPTVLSRIENMLETDARLQHPKHQTSTTPDTVKVSDYGDVAVSISSLEEAADTVEKIITAHSGMAGEEQWEFQRRCRAEIDRLQKIYEEKLPELLKESRGKYVALQDDKIIIDADCEALDTQVDLERPHFIAPIEPLDEKE